MRAAYGWSSGLPQGRDCGLGLGLGSGPGLWALLLTLCRSSMTNLPLGFKSAMNGTRSLTACAQ